jgi:hypothetical protein
MLTVSYETDGGVFVFDQKEATEVLQSLEANEANSLIQFLESKIEEVVKVPQETGSFSYAVLKLLDNGKGSVQCKICKRIPGARTHQIHNRRWGESLQSQCQIPGESAQ